MLLRRPFTQKQLDWWVRNKYPKAGKFTSVEHNVKTDTFTHTDDKGITRQIIPLEEQEDLIIELYTDAKTGLVSKEKFYKYLQDRYIGITQAYLGKVLMKVPSYQQFIPTRHATSTVRPIIAKRPYSRLQIDLVDFSKLAHHNSNYRYVLTCIDVFSKMAWVQPLKNKEASTVWAALASILDSLPQKPTIVQSDNGGEFKSQVSEGLKQKGIKQVFSSAYHPQSQGAIERWNATLKNMLKRYFAQNSTKKWLDTIDDIVDNYNKQHHTTTKRQPTELADEKITDAEVNAAHANIVKKARQKLAYQSSYKDDIEVGDHVRVALETSKTLLKNKLAKRGLNPTYSKEVYEVVKVIKPREGNTTVDTPLKYRLKGMKGLYYRNRLLKTVPEHEQRGAKAEDNDHELERDDDEMEEKTPAVEPTKPDIEPRITRSAAKKMKEKAKPTVIEARITRSAAKKMQQMAERTGSKRKRKPTS